VVSLFMVHERRCGSCMAFADEILIKWENVCSNGEHGMCNMISAAVNRNIVNSKSSQKIR
jgi:hypothetical protein